MSNAQVAFKRKLILHSKQVSLVVSIIYRLYNNLCSYTTKIKANNAINLSKNNRGDMAFPEETDRHKIDVVYTQWANTVITIKMIKLQNRILNEKCDLEGL